MKQIYIIRKYVVANSLKDAIKKEKLSEVHDCWLTDGSTNLLQDKLLK